MDTSGQREIYKTRRKGRYQAICGGVALATSATLNLISTAMYGGSWTTVLVFPAAAVAYMLGITASFKLGKFAGYWSGLVDGRNERNRSRFNALN